MRKWILTKELFDSEELKAQNEIPYLRGDFKKNTYLPMGIEKMNLNHLLLKCSFLGICLNDRSENHYATYEEGIYVFIFINDDYRLNIALDLKKKDMIDYAVCVYQLPIDLDNLEADLMNTGNETIQKTIDFLNGEVLEILEDFGFPEVINYGKRFNLTRFN